MRVLLASILFAVAFPSSAQISPQAVERWDRESPDFHFYSGGVIRHCSTCDTYVIVAATDRPSAQLELAFKRMSTLGGQTHQGVLMRRNQVLESINELTALGCKPPGEDRNIAYYVNRPAGQCVLIPYESEAQLLPILERMTAYLSDSDRVERELAGLAQADADKKLWEQTLVVAGAVASWIPELARALVRSVKITAKSTELRQAKP